ncbi:MAG: response regulator [Candidatus Acidiferrales bacterium]
MRRRILVVEDNLPNLELIRDWLESEGFDVQTAQSLQDAFASLKAGLPHAVLLDVQLGAEDGLALAAWVRREPGFRHLPIIAVTAHAMVTDQERVIQAGCNACISKPIEFGSLSEQLKRWLEHSEKLQSSR